MASTETQHPDWHMLDFFVDDHSDSALTVFACGSRFHIIADTGDLPPETNAGKIYRRLVKEYQASLIDTKAAEDSTTTLSNPDSGVDVNYDSNGSTKEAEDEETERPNAADDALQTWLFSPLANSINDHVPEQGKEAQRTIQEWYHCPTVFFELRASSNGEDVEAVELESSKELDERMTKLLPTTMLPKYLTSELTAPWFKASELVVLECSDKPVGTPYHPCRVRHSQSGETYFLKIVDNDQPQPVKRELSMLHEIEQKGLWEQFHVSQLCGLVTFDESEPTAVGQQRIMGFLLTDIPSPTPLTLKLDPDIPQEKREAWAEEADRIKNVLHKHDIIWGDAKADNFVVDGEDNLWIIDFGGSYTEGWVDERLNETIEGDDMGTEKIVNALHDPVNNVQRPDEEDVEAAVARKEEAELEDSHGQDNKKRKRNMDIEDPEQDDRPDKRSRTDKHSG